jgi:hypothetical protein
MYNVLKLRNFEEAVVPYLEQKPLYFFFHIAHSHIELCLIALHERSSKRGTSRRDEDEETKREERA